MTSSGKETRRNVPGTTNEAPSKRRILKQRKKAIARSELREVKAELRLFKASADATVAQLDDISGQISDIRERLRLIAQDEARTQLLIDQILIMLSGS